MGYKYFVYEHGAVLASFYSKLMFTLPLWPGSTLFLFYRVPFVPCVCQHAPRTAKRLDSIGNR